jgi:hypothetical protein
LAKLFQTSILLNYGMKKIRYRDARDIKADKRTLTFTTAVICTGNNMDKDLNTTYTQLDRDTYSGLEGCISNPVHIRHKRVDPKTTTVTVYLEHLEGFEIIQKE